MPAYRKASIRDLTQAAYELDGHFVEGRLQRDPASGQWLLGDSPLDQWLARHEGEDVTLILVAMESDRPIAERVCRTCGRRYIGTECPHCREVRKRLRGR